MSNYALLDFTLNQILVFIEPSREDWVVRYQIVDNLKAVVESMDNLRGVIVEPFGSFVSKLFSRGGDLDISIELFNNGFVSFAGKRRKLSVLEDVFRALRGRSEWRRVKFIGNARVPIIKLETVPHNISCDISIDNLLGRIKSKFLCWISSIDARFRNLVLLVKEWAKAHDMNNPRMGTLNSYSLTLLVIFHFQTCVPAILPPLREFYPGYIEAELLGLRAEAEDHIEETCAANMARFRSDRLRILNRSSLSELFISFFAKFSNIDRMALEQGISIQNGRWENINSNMSWLPQTYSLLIEDPFELSGNASRSVSRRQLERISEVMRATHFKLISPNEDLSFLLPYLVGPQIRHGILRNTANLNPSGRFAAGPTAPRNASSFNAGGQRGVRPPMQQGQYGHFNQNPRPGMRPNNSTSQRSVQQNQLWRPRSTHE